MLLYWVNKKMEKRFALFFENNPNIASIFFINRKFEKTSVKKL